MIPRRAAEPGRLGKGARRQISARSGLAAAILLAPALAGCGPSDGKAGEGSAAAAAEARRLDPYLDGYKLLQPDRLPEAAEIASGCDEATSHAISEMEAGGAILERTFETSIARKVECRWATDRRWIAACRFEKAEVPGGVDPGSEARREAVTHLRERDWTPAAARFALVQAGGLANSGDPARWIATDTCEPFVFKAGDWEIDQAPAHGEGPLRARGRPSVRIRVLRDSSGRVPAAEMLYANGETRRLERTRCPAPDFPHPRSNRPHLRKWCQARI